MGSSTVLLIVVSHIRVTAALASYRSFCDSSGWHPVWGDEFDGVDLNTSKWTKTLGNDGTEAQHIAGEY